jgi:hypothetical protein
MQFVPGGSIASILARFGALDEAVFRKYTKQILEGVEYLHANDVIHRYFITLFSFIFFCCLELSTYNKSVVSSF